MISTGTRVLTDTPEKKSIEDEEGYSEKIIG
jgi:hypothetical protein